MASLFQGIGHANLYSQYRPSPPTSLIEEIISYAKYKLNRPLKDALDVGCGSGQSTKVLAPYFKHVTGIDVSEAQIQQAKKDRSEISIHYRISCAENVPFSDCSMDLVTACQSAHWLNLDIFFSEAKRILVPKGVLAVYGHWLPLPQLKCPSKTKSLTEIIVDYLYEEQLGKYWNDQRYIVQRYYADINLPLSDLVRKTIVKTSTNSVSEYIGYLSTWSGYQELLKQNPNKAQELLEDVKLRIMKILEVDISPDQTMLDLETDYFLLMGRKI